MSSSGGFLLGVFTTIVLGTAAWQFGGSAVRDPVRAALCECADPLAVAQVTLATYQQDEKLLVHTETFNTRVSSRTALVGGLPAFLPDWFLSAQKSFLIPATVGYALPLAEIAPGDLRWDPVRRVLGIRRPRTVPQAPQPDMRAVGVTVRGELVLLLRDAQAQVDQALLAKAMAAASEAASRPEPVARAERDADVVLARTFERPLKAAGFADARVVVETR